MTEAEIKKILRRFERLKTERRKREGSWMECEKAVASFYTNWNIDSPPETTSALIRRVTNQPSEFLNTCVTGVAGYAMSSNIKWFKLQLQDKTLNDMPGVMQWIGRCENILLRTLERCGFYPYSLQWLEYSATYGCGGMLIEELHNADAPIRYQVIDPSELFLDRNEIGEVCVVFRSYWSGVENVCRHYGLKAMHENIRREMERIEGDESGRGEGGVMQLLHIVEPRRSGIGKQEETVAHKKWSSIVIDVKNKHVIKESGYDEFPYALFFWERCANPYGRGPTERSLNDIALYQAAYSNQLELMQKIVDPPFGGGPGLKGKVNSRPGGFTTYRSRDDRPEPYSIGENYPLTLDIVNKLENNVKKWFNVDFFVMLREASNIRNMTATAVSALQGEQVALLSALVCNMHSGLSAVIRRTFNILAKKQMLPPMPAALQGHEGGLKIDFLGVLAQAQKAAYEYTGLQDVLAVLGQFEQLAKIDPRYGRLKYWVDERKLILQTLEARGVPMEILRNEDEYEEIIAGLEQEDAAALAAQSAAQQKQAVMQNAQNLNAPVQPGSMLEGLLGGR